MPPRPLIVLAAVAAAFGIAVPYYRGAGFLDHRLIVAYACLPTIFAAPAAVSSFAPLEAPEARETLPAFQKLLRVWLLCWAFGTGILGIALLTINLAFAHGRLLLPRAGFLVAALCLGFTGSAAVAALAAELTRHLAMRTVHTMFRTGFLILIAALFLADRFFAVSLSTAAWTRLLFILAAVCGGAAVLFATRLPTRTVS